MATTTRTVRGLCVATRYTTKAELVDKLNRFYDGETIFIATQNTRPVGTASPVAILLDDRTPAVRGWCTVVEAWPDATSPFKRPGVRLALSRLTPESQRVLDELAAARGERRPRTEKYPLVKQQRPPTLQVPRVTAVLRDAFTSELPLFTKLQPGAVDELDPPTDRMSEDEIAVIRSATSLAPIVVERPPRGTPTLPPAETRTPHSSYILPANPLSELTDDSLRGFIDCRLYEELDEPAAPPPRPVTEEPPPLPPPPIIMPPPPTTTLLVEPPALRPQIRWDIVVATAMLALALVFAVAKLA